MHQATLAESLRPLPHLSLWILEFRNNLPDWDENDYSCHAVDAPTDITVHYDITGKSTTEGK